MNIDFILAFLGWCLAINIGLLIYSAGMLVFAQDWLYRQSQKWVDVPEEHFTSIYFLLMGLYKLLILFFNLIPYFALRFIS